MMVDNSGIHLELMLTHQCNFACKYCYENHDPARMKPEVLEQTLSWVEAQPNTVPITISFWGGEPTLEAETILAVCNRLQNRHNVSFTMSSNGSFLTALAPLLLKMRHRFVFQVSFDYLPGIRLLKNKRDPYEDILETMNELYNMGLNFSTKSTLNREMLLQLPQILKNFMAVRARFPRLNFNYFPTFNTSETFDDLSVEQFSDYMIGVEGALDAALAFSLSNRIGHLVSLFNPSAKLCSAGTGLCCVETDGRIMLCHQAQFMENNDRMQLGSVDDIGAVKQSMDWARANKQNNVCNTCAKCTTGYCMRCRAESISHAPSGELWDMAANYAFSERHCALMKMFDVYGKAAAQMAR